MSWTSQWIKIPQEIMLPRYREIKEQPRKDTMHNITDFLFRIFLELWLDICILKWSENLIIFHSKEIHHHILFPQLLWVNNIWNITNTAQLNLEHLYKKIIKSIQKIQMFYRRLMAFTYSHWIEYKVDMRYLIYTVPELLQNGKRLKFQFLRK